MKTPKENLVKIDWIDSVGTGHWGNNPVSNLNCSTVGHLVEKKKDRVVIAMNKSYCSKDSYGHFMEIPRVAIKKITKLK